MSGIASKINGFVVEHPGWVIAVFLALTLVMAGGLTNIGTKTGTSQFTNQIPAYEAQQEIDRKFSPVFSTDNKSTTLIQHRSDVLSKPALEEMLKLQRRLQNRPDLEVAGTSSAASMVAEALEPNASTLYQKVVAVETSTPTEIESAVKSASENPGFGHLLSEDFDGGSATYTISTLTHSISGGGGESSRSGGGELSRIQTEVRSIVEATAPEITVFGSGIINTELGNVIADSLTIVVPAVVLLMLLFLVVAYRDPIDLVLGLVSLSIAVIWTFGFMGWAGIPFSQMLITVPPLLLSVGIDFGIHNINRYREERVKDKGITESMTVTLNQLLVAFFVAAATTVIGFTANLSSDLAPIRTFGVVASIGIVFTAVIFSLLLPALKIYSDRLREKLPIPDFGTKPMGSSESTLSGFLTLGGKIGRKAPYLFLALMAVVTVAGGFYATGIDTSFSQEDFLPPEKQPGYIQYLPQSMQPHSYTVTRTINLVKNNFESGRNDRVTVLAEAPLRQDYVLNRIRKAGVDPPDSFVRNNFRAESTSVNTYIDAYAAQSPEYRELVERSDLDGNGVPDVNMNLVLDELLESPMGDRAENYVTRDGRDARIVYRVKSNATQRQVSRDAKQLTDRYPFVATATGQTIIFQAVSKLILQSAVKSMVIAIALSLAFLLVVYRVLHGNWSLGLVNIVPITVTLALLMATMRVLGVPFNAMTATILSITIGIGVDYSVHVIDRFTDEFKETDDIYQALETTLLGTGGALTGSMLTTAVGNGTLVLAITPILGQFGILLFISVFYGYLTSLIVVPPTLVVWNKLSS